MDWKLHVDSPPVQMNLFEKLSEIEEKIIFAFHMNKELSLDVLAFKSQLSISQVSSELLNMEFKGLIRSLPGRKYGLIH
jgi:DNA processing protein